MTNYRSRPESLSARRKAERPLQCHERIRALFHSGKHSDQANRQLRIRKGVSIILGRAKECESRPTAQTEIGSQSNAYFPKIDTGKFEPSR